MRVCNFFSAAAVAVAVLSASGAGSLVNAGVASSGGSLTIKDAGPGSERVTMPSRIGATDPADQAVALFRVSGQAMCLTAALLVHPDLLKVADTVGESIIVLWHFGSPGQSAGTAILTSDNDLKQISVQPAHAPDDVWRAARAARAARVGRGGRYRHGGAQHGHRQSLRRRLGHAGCHRSVPWLRCLIHESRRHRYGREERRTGVINRPGVAPLVLRPAGAARGMRSMQGWQDPMLTSGWQKAHGQQGGNRIPTGDHRADFDLVDLSGEDCQ